MQPLEKEIFKAKLASNLLVNTEGDPAKVQRVVPDLLALPRVTEDSSGLGRDHQLLADGHQVSDTAFNLHLEGLWKQDKV